MARTILEIAQEAAERDATAPAPASLFGTNNRIARILRSAIKDTMREYMRTAGWMGMSELHSSWAFAIRKEVYAYPMPPDFLRIIANTEQRNGWPLGLVGPATPQAWAAWLYGGSSVVAPMGWRIRNNALFVEPIPNADELVVIDYVSRYPVVSEIRAGDYDNTKSPPTAIAPLVARDGYLDTEGTTVIEAGQSANNGEFGQGSGWDDAIFPIEPLEVLRRILPDATEGVLPQVRRPEFTADTDLPAFDDDYILSIGMTFRLRRALGLPYAEHAAEYEAEMEMKAASDAGAARSFQIGTDHINSDVVPLGNGEWLV